MLIRVTSTNGSSETVVVRTNDSVAAVRAALRRSLGVGDYQTHHTTVGHPTAAADHCVPYRLPPPEAEAPSRSSWVHTEPLDPSAVRSSTLRPNPSGEEPAALVNTYYKPEGTTLHFTPAAREW